MKVAKLLFLFVSLVLVVGAVNVAYEGFFRKASYSTEAIYKVSNSSIEIVLERRCIHLFLAEYERNLVLRRGGRELLRREIAVDTGGHSRMNVYQVSPTEYFLMGDLSFDRYFLDISKVTVSEDIVQEKPKGAKFIGSFDRNENGEWRFIPADERAEQKSKI